VPQRILQRRIGGKTVASVRRLSRILAAVLITLALPGQAVAQNESSLRSKIERSREREQALAGAAARLGELAERAGREAAIVQGRLAEVEADLAGAEARLAATRERLQMGRRRLVRLQDRHADGRELLAAQLVADYKADPPDIVSLVLGADSFADLIERIAFARRIRDRNAEIVARVRGARVRTRHLASVLGKLAATRREEAQAIAARRAALASMRNSLAARQATLVSARAARRRALAGTRSGRVSAQRALHRLVAERRRAAELASAGPGGPWAIPWPIVQCESGGQNLPPNGAGASGYYQMLPETWSGLGGSTPHAYLASKAEQDRLAGVLWAGGAGAHNWVCAGMV
jgi:septal ring factor EnvC (AmiA/AmiB activator)